MFTCSLQSKTYKGNVHCTWNFQLETFPQDVSVEHRMEFSVDLSLSLSFTLKHKTLLRVSRNVEKDESFL